MAELIPVLMETHSQEKLAALFMYNDGGPDHNRKQLEMHTALLAFLVLGGIDTMVVIRTTPQQSWTNPLKRVISILNLGLQGCSCTPTNMDKDFETTMRKCNGMNASRREASYNYIKLH